METSLLIRHFLFLLTIVPSGVSKEIKEKIIGPRFKPHQFQNDMTNAVKIEQVRAKILRALNITLAPKKRELTNGQDGSGPVTSPLPQPNTTTILSEAAASARMDTMSFKLGSRITTPVEDIQSAILVVRLKAVQNPKKSKEDESDIEDKTVLAEKIKNLTKNRKITEEMRKQLQKEDGKSRSKEGPLSGDLENSRSNDMKRRNRMRELDLPITVKVVVRLVDETTGKRKRVTDTKVIVQKSTMMQVNLTKEVMEALRSPTHTLTIQVTCKRCRRRVQMENVFKAPKRKNRKSGHYARRLNPQRPFLVITTDGSSKSNVQNEIPQSRAKRQNSRDVCALTYDEFLKGGENLSDCCGLSVYVSFDQLGLGDVVLSPSGFSIVKCLQCKQADSKDLLRQSPSNPGDPAVKQCEAIHKSPLEMYYLNNNTSTLIPKRIEDLTDGECNCSS